MGLVEQLVQINTDMLSQLVLDIVTKHPNVDVEQLVLKAVSLKLLNASGAATIYANLPKRTLRVVESEFGHFVVTPDKLILDLETKCVIGQEDLNGKFQKLTKDTIQLCNKYKLRYELPFNLETESPLSLHSTKGEGGGSEPGIERDIESESERDIKRDLGLGHAVSSDEEEDE